MKSKMTDNTEVQISTSDGSDELRGNCFFGHKWTKWKQYYINMINLDTNTKYKQFRQSSYCLRCNKIKIKDVI
jgi:hypothetical protein